jgi:methionine synthase I (cobalamin-dependent)
MAGSSLIAELVAGGPVLLDGAWGTELAARGLSGGESPDFWNLHHPERVEAVARAYVDAGSRIILTNTFRANRIAQREHPERSRIAEVNRAGVEISRRAAAVDAASLRGAFEEQARALAAAGPDAIVIETMSDLEEAGHAIRAARDTGLPVVACMVYDSGKQKDRTMMGKTPEETAKALGELGADAIGANCGSGVAG